MTTQAKPDWTSAIVASVLATIAVTITFALSGNDIVKSLGMMILGSDASLMMQYTAGGVMHLAVGIAYGIAFALFFVPVQVWNKALKGVVFGFAITAVALTLMPLMATLVGGGQTAAANPCMSQVQNPCRPTANPCGMGTMQPCGQARASNPCAMNACNPCGGGGHNPCASNPCNPCGSASSHDDEKVRTIAMTKGGNPCRAASHPCATSTPCAGANPCGGSAGGNRYAGLISLLNHIAFALTLSFLTRTKRRETA